MMFSSSFSRSLLRGVSLSSSSSLPFSSFGNGVTNSRFSLRLSSSDGLSTEEWTKRFEEAAVDLKAMDVDNISYEDSASRMRSLLRSRLLLHDDLFNNPDRFFRAHRIIANHAATLGPGFWVRFTVHYNLCVGTVLGLGNSNHLEELKRMQDEGLLGCFGLTEKLAGVSSGLVVQTTADYDPSSETFVINSSTEGAEKNWISQGFVGDKIVVLADLRMNGKSYGPHAFFIDLRRDGQVVKGITLGDMGRKTVGNDLDNAWIRFEDVVVPKSTLLNRFGDIEGENYVQKVEGIPPFQMIGQRLFTGRVAVAQAAMAFRGSLFQRTREYADSKLCWAPKDSRPLSQLPHLQSLFEENDQSTEKLNRYLGIVEEKLSDCLKKQTIPSSELVEAIAAAKVRAVEDSIQAVFRLQNEVGSFALMHGTGFEQRDFLTCCKFAEGDSRILMQKLARDRVRRFQKKQLLVDSDPLKWDAETQLSHHLFKAVAEDPNGGWDREWRNVYRLADMIIDRVVDGVVDGGE